ncbi:MAG: alpha/beta hydrolase [Lachnospiraceae bacterium]
MNPENKNIPRNPNKKMSDDEINELLELAAAQVNSDNYRENIDLKQKEAAEREVKQKEEAKKKEAAEREAKRKEEAKKKEAAEREAKRKEEAKKKEAAEREAKRKEEAKKKEAAEREAKRKEEAKKKEAVEREAKRKEEAKKKETAEREAKQKEVAKKKEVASKDMNKSNENKKEVSKKENKVDFDDVYVTTPKENPYKEKWTFGRVIGTFLEFVWTVFKIAVIVAVVTVISGVLLSRDLMIRGRSGERQCLQDMTVASSVNKNKSLESTRVESWLKSVDVKKHTLEADDGKILIARSYTKGGNRWVVVLHGYGETMEDVNDIAMHYSNEGYNILIPDLRAHGESEGAFYGMGWLDRFDVINWIDMILEENPSAQIAIHGVDVGADTALMLAGEPLKSNIKVIVAEGAYTRAYDVVKKEFKVRHPKLPSFPFLYMINPVMKVWAGYSLVEADATKQVVNAKIPILLIAGNNDTYVDSEMTEELNQTIGSPHEVITIANGAHGDCRYSDGETYYNKALEFVKNNMN